VPGVPGRRAGPRAATTERPVNSGRRRAIVVGRRLSTDDPTCMKAPGKRSAGEKGPLACS
jgi:hypothetical protein